MELFRAFRAQLAPVLGTVALVIAVAGVVFAPGFVTDESAASRLVQAKEPGAAATVALRH
jgi:hypothetical protein